MNLHLREMWLGLLQEAASAITAGVIDTLEIAAAARQADQNAPLDDLTGYPEVTGEQAAEIARSMGMDPEKVKVVKIPKGQSDAASGEKMVRVRGGKYIAWKDIPKGPDGQPDPDWVEENCDCDDHQKKREEAQCKKRAMNNGYI